MSESRHNLNEGGKIESLRDALAGLSARQAEELPWHQAGRGREEASLILDEHRVIARRWAPDAAWSGQVEGEAGAFVRVVSGLVEEERYLPDGDGLRYEVVVLKPGAVSYLPRGGYRRLEAITQAVTLHVEAPCGRLGTESRSAAPPWNMRNHDRPNAA